MPKITRVGLNIVLDELRALEKMLPGLYDAAEKWTDVQKERDQWGSTDGDWAYWKRNKLEKELDQVRDQLSKVYDEMHDRGLVEVE